MSKFQSINSLDKKFVELTNKELVETNGGFLITTSTAIGFGIVTGAVVTYNYVRNRK